jgi:hypothetical protein
MLSFLKKIFGSKPAETTPAPYKVENTVPQVAEFPFPTAKPAETKTAVKKPVAKKPAAKKAVRKPKQS